MALSVQMQQLKFISELKKMGLLEKASDIAKYEALVNRFNYKVPNLSIPVRKQ